MLRIGKGLHQNEITQTESCHAHGSSLISAVVHLSAELITTSGIDVVHEDDGTLATGRSQVVMPPLQQSMLNGTLGADGIRLCSTTQGRWSE